MKGFRKKNRGAGVTPKWVYKRKTVARGQKKSSKLRKRKVSWKSFWKKRKERVIKKMKGFRKKNRGAGVTPKWVYKKKTVARGQKKSSKLRKPFYTILSHRLVLENG